MRFIFQSEWGATCKIFGPGSMCETKDSVENPGLEANNGNVAHRRRLAKLWEK